ncbi:MAG: glycosyltransferase [Spirochaetia bacterium]|nr:glycosyltransferase [Spirochaetia bacterium]
MKIAFCTEYLLPQINGIAVRCDEYIKHLHLENHVIDVYGPKNHDKTTSEIHTITNFFNKGNRIALFPNIKLLYKILLKKYDIVHVVLPLFAWFPLIALFTKISGTKLVLSNHVNLSFYSRSYFNSKILIEICKLIIKYYYRFQNLVSDLIMAPSNFEETQKFIEPEKFQIIKTGIDTNLFYPKPKEKVRKEIIYVGRVAPEKGLDNLFSLFLLLKDYKLTVIGDGPELPRLKNLFENNPNIEFLGFVSHDKLTPYYQRADFHLVSSLSETFGFTLIESMACGTPVIYPDCGVFRSLYYENFPELIYNVEDRDSFLRAVENLNSNLNHYSNKSIEYSERHSWESATKDLVFKYYHQTETLSDKYPILTLASNKFLSYLMILVYFGFCTFRYVKN